MRILIDIQSLQGDSKYRGIGRYVSNLVTNMINTKNKDDEIYLLYNDWNEKTQTDIINKFKEIQGIIDNGGKHMYDDEIYANAMNTAYSNDELGNAIINLIGFQ